MPRPRKPTKELERKGAFKKDPQRLASRENEPEPNGEVGAPPAYFDDEHAAIWAELVAESHEGVLCKADRKLLELTVRLTRKMRVIPGRAQKWINSLAKLLEATGAETYEIEQLKNDLRAAVGCSAQELSLLASCLTRMGLTPADRSRVHADHKKKKPGEAANPFQDFEKEFAQPSPRAIGAKRPN
jgi:hypothetical protein